MGAIREFDATATATRSARRRAALERIFRDRAEPILERVVAETLRATDFVGLGKNVAIRYLVTAKTILPMCIDALGSPDEQRSQILSDNSVCVQELIAVGVPKFVQRALISLGFRIASGVARDNARAHGFEPDELEDELRVFQRAFEARLFFGV